MTMKRLLFSLLLTSNFQLGPSYLLAAEAPATPPKTDAADSARLAGDTLTVSEAKTLVATHAAEKQQLEIERQAVLAKAAKLNQADRAKLINDFLTATSARRKKAQDEAPRIIELTIKVKDAEKNAAIPAKPKS